MIQHLPNYGWEVVDDPYVADVVNCHAGEHCDFNINKPWVASNHGLYWNGELDFGNWTYEANARVINNIKRADVVTVPSEWVAQSIRRGTLINPQIIGHGINPDEWPLGENGKYVLWNKGRVDVVCSPEPLNKLAMQATNITFVSTFGNSAPNIKVIGRVPYDDMKKVVNNAGVYLCTARETFGIGTIEAMCSGVPVLGWAYGGQCDIVKHLQHGWLAEPNNYESLREGLEYCVSHRDELGAAAREHVLKNYQWSEITSLYDRAFRDAIALHSAYEALPKVSVVVTCYNLAKYLPDCLDNMINQTMPYWECIVVDDCSPDDTAVVAQGYCEKDSRIKYIKTETNQYLAGARNVGIKASVGKYILCLDADDYLTTNALELLVNGVEKDPTIDIAYGHMEAVYSNKIERGNWPGQFRMEQLMSGRNQFPYASMYKRKVWDRIGGYRKHIRTAEDADMWCRATSYGLKPYKVTDQTFLMKRERDDSMSRVEPVSRDWREWFPWAKRKELAPFGALMHSELNINQNSWPVRSFESPKVSVIIPVGSGHEQTVIRAIDSVVAQSYIDWEVIVCIDTPNKVSLDGFPFVKVVYTTSKNSGASIARNTACKVAKGKYLVFLDADDRLYPEFIEACMSVIQKDNEYVYTDAFLIKHDKEETFKAGLVNPEDHLLRGKHAVTVLIPRKAWQDVKGFDENLSNWEDWDFFIAVSDAGYFPVYLEETLVEYDTRSGYRREDAVEHKKTIKNYVHKKWDDYFIGEKRMGCCGSRRSRATAAPAVQSGIGTDLVAPEGMVLLRYIPSEGGTISYRGSKTGLRYRFGPDEDHKIRPVHKMDAPDLVIRTEFEYA